MKNIKNYEKPTLASMPLDMCEFVCVSMVDLSTDSEQKSATQKFNDGQYQEIY